MEATFLNNIMTKRQKKLKKIEDQSMCYADVSCAYYLGKKFALKYGKHVLGTSSTPFAAEQARNRFRNKFEIKAVKIVPLEKVVQDHRELMEGPDGEKILRAVGKENYHAEIKRITDLLNPVNDEEVEAVKEVALDNLMKKAVIEAIPWGTIHA
jgi:hypothetical protein